MPHDHMVNFERGCRINGQRTTNVSHSLQNNNKQKIFLSVFIYHLNRYIYIEYNLKDFFEIGLARNASGNLSFY